MDTDQAGLPSPSLRPSFTSNLDADQAGLPSLSFLHGHVRPRSGGPSQPVSSSESHPENGRGSSGPSQPVLSVLAHTRGIRRALPACPSGDVFAFVAEGASATPSSDFPLALSWFSGPVCQLRAFRALGLRVFTFSGGLVTLRVTGGRAIIIAVSKCHVQPLSWKAIFYGAELAYVAVRAKFRPVLQ